MVLVQKKNANQIIQIIFVQFVLLTVINAEYGANGNATNYEILPKAERLIGAPFHRYIPPDTLTATIKDGDKEIHLTWKRVDRYLANEHLPVYTARINDWGPNHRKSDVMKTVGKFIMYHDVVQKSAITYLENLDKINGVVGRSYHIFDLPIDRLSQPLEVDGIQIHRMPHRVHGKKKKATSTTENPQYNEVVKREINSGKFNIRKLRNRRDVEPDPLYIETLLFVTYDIFQTIRNRLNGGFLSAIVINYLFYFNAIDMVFADLPSDKLKIYINLAGIIIEEEDGAFSRITNHPSLKYDNNNILDINFLFEEFERYPNHFDFPFTRDSFDLIMISTGRELEFGRMKPYGWHSDTIDIFSERKQDRLLSVPMTIVRSTNVFSSYGVAAHEIGKVLGIRENDPFDQGLTDNGMQCYGIMQSSQHHCAQCLKWSDESISQLKVFTSGNRNRCFYLNKPRSLHPPGTPIISQTPCHQCTCFGYNSYAEERPNECPRYIPSDGCAEALQCKYKDAQDKLQLESTIFPLDGTPCGENKVCWEEKCSSLDEVISDPTSNI